MTSASASCPESEAAGQRAAGAEPAPQRLTLAEFVQRYGRAVCQDRYRCAALIRDLCAGEYREHFLWTMALHEGIVTEILEPPPGALQSLLLSGLAVKLSERLGLSRDAATWAVRSWSEALQNAPERTEVSFAPAIATASRDDGAGQRAHARRWLGWCCLTLTTAAVALMMMAWCVFQFDLSTVGRWFQETVTLAGACALAWWGLWAGSRRLLQWQRPDWLHLPPARAVAAVVPEVLLIVLLPLVPVASVALWAAACFVSWPQVTGPVQVAWVLARLLQALLLAVFIVLWTPLMIETEGRMVAGWRECR